MDGGEDGISGWNNGVGMEKELSLPLKVEVMAFNRQWDIKLKVDERINVYHQVIPCNVSTIALEGSGRTNLFFFLDFLGGRGGAEPEGAAD